MEARLVWDGNGRAPAALRGMLARGFGVATVTGTRLQARFEAGASTCLKLVSIEAGRAELRTSRGRERLQPGDLVLLDPRDGAELCSDAGFRHAVAFVPRFEGRLIGQAWAAQAADEPLLGLLRGWRRSAGLSPSSGWAAAMAMSQLLAERLSAGPAPQAWVQRQSRSFVELDLAAVTPDSLAARLRLSRRRLDQLLAAQGLTASRLIWACRLQRAAGLLRMDAQASITTIAHGCGFKDSSHFSRLFRQAYGQAPSAWRAQVER